MKIKIVLVAAAVVSVLFAVMTFRTEKNQKSVASEVISRIRILSDTKFDSEREFVASADFEYMPSFKISTKEFAIIEEGPYVGRALVLARIYYEDNEPKDPLESREKIPTYLRFIKTDSEMILLKTASSSFIPWQDSESKKPDEYFFESPFKKITVFPGYELKTDPGIIVSGFDLPNQIIFDNNPRAKIEFRYENDINTVNTSQFQKFRDYRIWEVYTVKPEVSFALKSFQKNWESSDESDQLYKPNQSFYIKKVDGTVAFYFFYPDVEKDGRISDQFAGEFTFHAHLGCSPDQSDRIDIVTAKITTELSKAGQALNGDDLYFPPQDMIEEFFHYFQNTKEVYVNSDNSETTLRTHMLNAPAENKIVESMTYEEFRSQNPILLWKNPLGQWVRLTQVKFLKPRSCG